MATVTTIAREQRSDALSDSERRCLVTGAVAPKSDLIRFVVAPDQTVVPDLSQNLPGRGLWVSADREAVENAARKNLFSRAAKTQVKADPDLADRVAELLEKRCLDLLGLAKGAGIAILGQPQVEAALKAGKLALLIVADDAAAAGLERVDRTSFPAIRRLSRQALGRALGYEQVVYVGLLAHNLTEKLRSDVNRLEKIAGTRHLKG
jgi:predicted RNA-binding protein YlxR (DUF448 family)